MNYSIMQQISQPPLIPPPARQPRFLVAGNRVSSSRSQGSSSRHQIKVKVTPHNKKGITDQFNKFMSNCPLGSMVSLERHCSSTELSNMKGSNTQNYADLDKQLGIHALLSDVRKNSAIIKKVLDEYALFQRFPLLSDLGINPKLHNSTTTAEWCIKDFSPRIKFRKLQQMINHMPPLNEICA
jgi:hypothetical protein